MDLQKYYGYEDVFIIPNYSNVLTRNEVSTDVTLGSKERAFTLKIPIISANMDTITENRMINISLTNFYLLLTAIECLQLTF